MVQGHARALLTSTTEGGGSGGAMIRITSDKIVSWGLEASDG
jgi:hypothetical protein